MRRQHYLKVVVLGRCDQCHQIRQCSLWPSELDAQWFTCGACRHIAEMSRPAGVNSFIHLDKGTLDIGIESTDRAWAQNELLIFQEEFLTLDRAGCYVTVWTPDR